MLKGVVLAASVLCLVCGIAFGSEFVFPSSHQALAQNSADVYQGPIPEDNVTDNNPDDMENGPIVEDSNNFIHDALDQNYENYEDPNGNSQTENSDQTSALDTNTHYHLPVQIKI